MRIVSIQTLRGPNVWAACPVIEALIEWCPLAGAGQRDCFRSVARRVEQSLRLTALRLLPGAAACRVRGAAARGEGAWLVPYGRLIARGTAQLVNATGGNTQFIAVAPSSPRRIRVLVEYGNAEQVKSTLVDVAGLVDRAHQRLPEGLIGQSEAECTSPRFIRDPNTAAIVAAASARGIPVLPFHELGYVQLGHGKLQRRVSGAQTNRTSALALELAQDKQVTKELLMRHGLPTPPGQVVRSADEAWQAACRLGLPVVVKPLAGDFGDGVTLNLSDRCQVEAACEWAFAEGESVLVERYLPGSDHRLLVVAGRVVAAARRDPPIVVGDGCSTIAQLVARENGSQQRRADASAPLSPIRLDQRADAWLATLGLSRCSVPPSGRRVQVRGNAHLKTGGSNHDITRHVHAEVARCAAQAVRLLDLDIAGVDIVAKDIARPLAEQGGAIVEVNAVPGMVQHLWPLCDAASPVGEAIVDSIFSPADCGRIPIAAIWRSRGSAALVQQVAELAWACGRFVGAASTAGLTFNRRQASTANSANARGAEAVLMHPEVDLAVLEVSSASVRHHGLAFEAPQVAVFCDGDDFGRQWETPAARVLIAALKCNGFLVLPPPRGGAWDPMPRLPVDRMIYFCTDPLPVSVRRHLSAGGRAVVCDPDCVRLATGNHTVCIAAPLALNQPLAEKLKLAACVAVVWALELPLQQLRAALRQD